MIRRILCHLFSSPAAMFYCLTTSALHREIGSPSGFPASIEMLAYYFFLNSIALWVTSDAGRRARKLPYDFDFLIFFAWIVAAPVYLWQTRRWRAVIPLLIFAFIYAAAALVSAIPRLLQP
jgi:hypothetical protein